MNPVLVSDTMSDRYTSASGRYDYYRADSGRDRERDRADRERADRERAERNRERAERAKRADRERADRAERDRAERDRADRADRDRAERDRAERDRAERAERADDGHVIRYNNDSDKPCQPSIYQICFRLATTGTCTPVCVDYEQQKWQREESHNCYKVAPCRNGDNCYYVLEGHALLCPYRHSSDAKASGFWRLLRTIADGAHQRRVETAALNELLNQSNAKLVILGDAYSGMIDSVNALADENKKLHDQLTLQKMTLETYGRTNTVLHSLLSIAPTHQVYNPEMPNGTV